jgi:hypothetical protein
MAGVRGRVWTGLTREKQTGVEEGVEGRKVRLTFMENIAHGTIVQNHDFAEIRFDAGQVLDVRALPERAVLAVIPAHEVFPLQLQPVDDWVGVFLDGSGEDDKFVPFAYLLEEFVAVGTFVHVVEDRVLWADDLGWLICG